MENLSSLQKLSVYFVPFFMAVVFHEFAHGWIASKYGDSTAKDQGRLTLNPIPHVDILGTLILPIIMMLSGASVLFGWAKPVPINPSRFRNYRSGLFWVSFAGPLMNFFLAFISALSFCAVIAFIPEGHFLSEPLQWMTSISVYLNYGIGLFNLLPLPPLDGSKMIQSFLSYNATQKYEQLSQYSFFILLALIMTNALSFLMIPIQFLGHFTLGLAAAIFGLGGIA